MTIVDGKKLSQEILNIVKDEVARLSFKPVFCDVLVGNDPASIQYVEMKAKGAESVGIAFHRANFPITITTQDLVKEIQILNKMENMCGIILQLPLPDHIDRRAALDAIAPDLDVDCLGTIASDRFYSGLVSGEGGFPTALACLAILDSLNLDLRDKNIVVLGQGNLVGRPVAALLRFRNINPVVLRSQTENKNELLRSADVIISGIGNGKYLTGDMVKAGVVIIDAGTSEDNGSIVGDVDAESVKDVAGFLSPVPGGVGPVTVAMLLQNVLTVAKKLK